jgi:hypothetical protein
MKTTTISDTIVQEVSVAARRRTDQRQGASARANFAAERNQAACDAPNLSVHLCGKPLDGEGLAERDLAHCARTVRQALWLALGIARGLVDVGCDGDGGSDEGNESIRALSSSFSTCSLCRCGACARRDRRAEDLLAARGVCALRRAHIRQRPLAVSVPRRASADERDRQ